MEMIKTVTVRNTVFGDGEPKICIPITARDFGELNVQLEKLTEVPYDMAEWRADFFAPEGSADLLDCLSDIELLNYAGGAELLCDMCTEDVCGVNVLTAALCILKEKIGGKPLLFTFRTKAEGGEREITPEQYVQLNLAAAASGMADMVDIELNRGEELFCDLAKRIHQTGKSKVLAVGSFHNFSETPKKEEIVRTLCTMQRLGADITKAAVMPQSGQDVLTLLDASLVMKTQLADRPFITMSMGALGAVSRLCGRLTGSAVTFATAGSASAPGQMEAETVAHILNSTKAE